MGFWFTRGLSFLPIFLIVWTYLTFTISYLVAVISGDVDPVFPYISDTGAKRPESSLFGQMLNIAAVAAFMTLYVRYKEVEVQLTKFSEPRATRIRRLNTLSFVCAILTPFGISLVANFQEISVEPVHYAGAILAFGVGTLYEFIQTIMSYMMCPEVHSKKICHVRLGLSILSVAFLLTAGIAMEFAEVPARFHWTSGDVGYAAHVTSTIAEWCMAGSFLVYFYTFIKGFQTLKMEIGFTIHDEDDLICGSRDTSANRKSASERTPLVSNGPGALLA